MSLVAPAAAGSTGTVNVAVQVTGVFNLGAFQLALEYDSTLVQATGITIDPSLGQETRCNPALVRCAVGLGPNATGNNATVGAYTYGTGAGLSGDGVIARLQLQANGLEGTTPLQINHVILADTQGNPIASQAQDGSLTVGDPIFRDGFESGDDAAWN